MGEIRHVVEENILLVSKIISCLVPFLSVPLDINARTVYVFSISQPTAFAHVLLSSLPPCLSELLHFGLVLIDLCFLTQHSSN